MIRPQAHDPSMIRMGFPHDTVGLYGAYWNGGGTSLG